MTNEVDSVQDPLPPSVRARMIALACQGLDRMPPAQVPISLRKSASFAPAKRPKLVGSLVAAAVDSDDEFREHLATQVRALVPTVVAALEAGTSMTDGASVDSAATAYIVRPDGWTEVVEQARAFDEERRRSASGGDLAATVERLTADLAQARGEAKAAREKLKSQIDQLKGENAQLRRTLGSTRVQLKEAQAAAKGAAAQIDAARRHAEVAAREADAEARRLKARVSDLESEAMSLKRASRDQRDAETMRLRLLLDSVTDAAAGLRRELALPPSDLLPADTVPAVEPVPGGAIADVGRALLNDDPVLLRRLLELPRLHLIVDGYNVSKTAWPSSPLDQQRSRLISGIAGLVAGKGIEVTIVFDGADLANPPSVVSPRGIRVRFSPPGVIADDLIRQLVTAEPVGRAIVVVSTDREVATSVTTMGARAVASSALVGAMGL